MQGQGSTGDGRNRRAWPGDLRTPGSAAVSRRSARHRSRYKRRRRAEPAGKAREGRPRCAADRGGRHEFRLVRAGRRSHRTRARTGRHPRQLRGDHPRRIAAQARQGRMGRGAFHESRQRLQRDQAGHRRDDAARIRPDREHILAQRTQGTVRADQLLRGEGGHAWIHDGAGPGGRPQGGDREHRIPGVHEHEDGRRGAAGNSRANCRRDSGRPPRRHPRDRGSRPGFSAPTKPDSSPERTTASTVATTCTDGWARGSSEVRRRGEEKQPRMLDLPEAVAGAIGDRKCRSTSRWRRRRPSSGSFWDCPTSSRCRRRCWIMSASR